MAHGENAFYARKAHKEYQSARKPKLAWILKTRYTKQQTHRKERRDGKREMRHDSLDNVDVMR